MSPPILSNLKNTSKIIKSHVGTGRSIASSLFLRTGYNGRWRILASRSGRCKGEKKLLCCGCRRPAYFCLLKKNTASLRTGDTHQISTNKNPHLAGILSGGRSVVRHGRTGAFACTKNPHPRRGGLESGTVPGTCNYFLASHVDPFFFRVFLASYDWY